ncbi:MAG: hypothetical protein AVDCRST_MAG56-5222 [uncultured Cytophagales bacterium]|uniref:T9SS type A sorting domain-containing protein n=1 Tax=uncultured Cytophagales bacterium TaxID=158755 RepID=A0A6J4K8Z1_9SPHI|nr:MAG: hypothetical protein AVDCRST_MAG56-5222 [uncultured Cytophagales bacterium]
MPCGNRCLRAGTALLFTLTGIAFFAGGAYAQRLGLHVTQQELNIWKARAGSTLTSGTTNYRVKGDVSANSPGDWSRIVANANTFKSNPAAERYKAHETTTTCIQQGSSGEPHLGEKLRDAAFAYLVTGDVTYRDAVRTELLAQAAEPSTDFSNTSRWCSNVIRDVNPGFFTAAWLTRLLFAYDYIRPSLGAADKARLEKWFFNAAEYFQARNVDVDLQKIWQNRYNGLYEPNYNSNGTTYYDIDLGAHTTHYGGATFANLSKWHNNRRSVMTSFFTSVGVMLGVENNVVPAEVGLTSSALAAKVNLFKERGKLFVKEWLMFSVRADGTVGEMERWESTLPEQGWQYALILVDHVLMIADHLARAGDPELYNYTTSAGKYGTEGGPKSLQATATHMLKYVDRTLNRYATDQAARSTDNNYRIDAISPLEGKHYVFDTWVAQSNLYWKNAYLKSIYTRQATGTSAYPANATGSGQYNAWTGGFGVFPGKLFMFGQLENVVNPYATSTTFYRAINLNGAALTIDGRSWEAGGTAANFSATGRVFSNQGVTLSPATDASRATMIRSSVYSVDIEPATVTLSSVPAGTYDVYLYTWEDNASDVFDITLEGTLVANDYVTGPPGTWARLGPWRTNVTDGTIVLTATGGAGNLSGLEVFQVGNPARLAADAGPETGRALPAVRPNPFTDRVTVTAGNGLAGKVTVTVVDLLGKVYYQAETTLGAADAEITLDLAGKIGKPGVYLLKMRDAHARSAAVKLVKE